MDCSFWAELLVSLVSLSEIGFNLGIYLMSLIPTLGHYLDQKRLKQGLYRHPWDDISYVLPESQMSTN